MTVKTTEIDGNKIRYFEKGTIEGYATFTSWSWELLRKDGRM